ncbi:MAG: class I SAM-dependent methyltransferase [Caulobacteraceae bacterium]
MPSFVPNTGGEFEDEDVVRAYAHRTKYPPALLQRLLDLTSGRNCALDLGCGLGQFACAFAPRFGEVLAVDPSAAMLRLGRSLDAGAHPNIRWIEATAEEVRLNAVLDLAVAGASVHWMNCARVMPKLAAALAPDGYLALIGGDGPADAPWIDDWKAIIMEWVGRLGGVWDDAEFRARAAAREPWIDIAGAESFTYQVRQSVEDLIEAEHSRATWARSKVGNAAQNFDADLRAIVAPFAEGGEVEFMVTSKVKWGRPRSTHREAPDAKV